MATRNGGTRIVSDADGPDKAVLRRIAELGAWLDTRLATRDRLIALPLTGEQLTLRGPDRAARERLFATAGATTDRQLPYWADIWPSGLALGDLLLDRADALAGTRALELGCGLGITATAALAADLDLTVADYSPISLAFCRFNALRNTGREPQALAFNWRDPLPEVLAQIGDPSPLPADPGGGHLLRDARCRAGHRADRPPPRAGRAILAGRAGSRDRAALPQSDPRGGLAGDDRARRRPLAGRAARACDDPSPRTWGHHPRRRRPSRGSARLIPWGRRGSARARARLHSAWRRTNARCTPSRRRARTGAASPGERPPS